MAGQMRRFAAYLGLVEDDMDLDAYEADRVDERPRPEPRPSSPTVERTVRPVPEVAPRPTSTSTVVADRPTPTARPAPAARTSPAPAPAARPATTPAPDGFRITTLHPRTYNEARRIGEEYREDVPVIINLTGMDDSDAKRIVDFSAGLVFGLRGTIERISNKVFLLSPANVNVGDVARRQIAQDGFFNQS